MTKTREEVEALVAAELDRVVDPARRAELHRHLARPELVTLGWEYGPPDELSCWLVGVRGDGRLHLVYNDDGFGPDLPWGAVFAASSSMGMDAQWSSRLEGAAIKAGILE